jgi:hypothetical protein
MSKYSLNLHLFHSPLSFVLLSKIERESRETAVSLTALKSRFTKEVSKEKCKMAGVNQSSTGGNH